MKHFALFLFVALAFGLQATPDTGDDKYKADVTSSVIEWTGKKVTGKHHGTIMIKEGGLDFSEGMLTGGSFTIDMATIKVTDLQGEYAGKLEGHLKSDDFFGIANFPTAKFEIVKAVPYGTDGSYKIVGNLTIKETTKEIKFRANVSENDNGKTAEANITIDRSEFNVRYGSGSFFDNLGDKTIYDEFDLVVKLNVTKA